MINLQMMKRQLHVLRTSDATEKQKYAAVQQAQDLVSVVAVWGDWDEELAMITLMKRYAQAFPNYFEGINFN